MSKFFSPSTRGFYSEDDHGARLIEHVTTDPETGETLDRWTEPNPDCKMPSDAVEIPDEHHQALLNAESNGKRISGDASGHPIAIDPSPEEIEAAKIKSAEGAVQKMLDAQAKNRGYDNIINASLRAGYPGPFHNEGVAFANWMDACWAKCYEILAAVKTGTRAEPTIDDLLAEMPALVLP
jgi:hypothetical protein